MVMCMSSGGVPRFHSFYTCRALHGCFGASPGMSFFCDLPSHLMLQNLRAFAQPFSRLFVNLPVCSNSPHSHSNSVPSSLMLTSYTTLHHFSRLAALLCVRYFFPLSISLTFYEVPSMSTLPKPLEHSLRVYFARMTLNSQICSPHSTRIHILPIIVVFSS